MPRKPKRKPTSKRPPKPESPLLWFRAYLYGPRIDNRDYIKATPVGLVYWDRDFDCGWSIEYKWPARPGEIMTAHWNPTLRRWEVADGFYATPVINTRGEESVNMVELINQVSTMVEQAYEIHGPHKPGEIHEVVREAIADKFDLWRQHNKSHVRRLPVWVGWVVTGEMKEQGIL